MQTRTTEILRRFPEIERVATSIHSDLPRQLPKCAIEKRLASNPEWYGRLFESTLQKLTLLQGAIQAKELQSLVRRFLSRSEEDTDSAAAEVEWFCHAKDHSWLVDIEPPASATKGVVDCVIRHCGLEVACEIKSPRDEEELQVPFDAAQRVEGILKPRLQPWAVRVNVRFDGQALVESKKGMPDSEAHELAKVLLEDRRAKTQIPFQKVVGRFSVSVTQAIGDAPLYVSVSGGGAVVRGDRRLGADLQRGAQRSEQLPNLWIVDLAECRLVLAEVVTGSSTVADLQWAIFERNAKTHFRNMTDVAGALLYERRIQFGIAWRRGVFIENPKTSRPLPPEAVLLAASFLAVEPPEDARRVAAYFHWEKRGRPHGDEWTDWFSVA